MIRTTFLTLCILGLTACDSSKSNLEREVKAGNQDVALKACIQKGVKYYQDLGSYPTLSTGGSADIKIRDKCNFNISIFD